MEPDGLQSMTAIHGVAESDTTERLITAQHKDGVEETEEGLEVGENPE